MSEHQPTLRSGDRVRVSGVGIAGAMDYQPRGAAHAADARLGHAIGPVVRDADGDGIAQDDAGDHG